MHSNQIIWPVLAQIFLTLVIFIILGVRKSKAIKGREVDRKQAALNNQAWPKDVIKVSNNIANQFEVPVLFYILCLVIYSINAVDILSIALAWSFTVSRFAHAYIHLGTNFVPMRFRLFFFGCVVLIAMLMLVAWKLVG